MEPIKDKKKKRPLEASLFFFAKGVKEKMMPYKVYQYQQHLVSLIQIGCENFIDKVFYYQTKVSDLLLIDYCFYVFINLDHHCC